MKHENIRFMYNHICLIRKHCHSICCHFEYLGIVEMVLSSSFHWYYKHGSRYVYNSHKTQVQGPVCSLHNTGMVNLKKKNLKTTREKTTQMSAKKAMDYITGCGVPFFRCSPHVKV